MIASEDLVGPDFPQFVLDPPRRQPQREFLLLSGQRSYIARKGLLEQGYILFIEMTAEDFEHPCFELWLIPPRAPVNHRLKMSVNCPRMASAFSSDSATFA